MQNFPNTFLDSYRHQIDASRHIADAMFDGTDRIEHLMIDSMRKAFDEQMKFYQALAAARDAQGVASLQSTFFSHTPERMMKVQQELVKIVNDAQHQITSTMDEYRTMLSADATLPMRSMGAMLGQPAGGNGGATASATSDAMTNLFSIWDKGIKESYALANRMMSASLTSKKGNGDGGVHVETTSSPAATTSASRKRAKRK